MLCGLVMRGCPYGQVDSVRSVLEGEAVVLTISLLGPFEVSMGGAAVAVPPGRLSALLAVLAMNPGETVSVGRLAAAVWGDDLPENPRRAVQLYITRLRALLGKDLIQTRPAGYVLAVAPGQVDLSCFLRLLDAATAERGVTHERKLLREALALWRGRPFEGIRSPWLEVSEAPWLTERYLSAAERHVDLEITSGHAAGVIAELAELTAGYPLRETLWVRWLVSLAACDRHAEALERYEVVRLRLAEELGSDPGPELQAAYADLLAGQVPLLPGGASARRIPRQLPADVAGFTGRQAALRELAVLLSDPDGRADGPVTISAISGPAGIGKSALAVHAAHRLLRHYPDGQLYVDLQGATPGLQPLAPLEVLGRFLRALGIDPSAVPVSEAEASARFRSETAGQRILVMLDNAAEIAQIRPLLPGTGCAVLVTSRHVLSTLDGARHLRLDVLTPQEASALLGQLVGRGRVAAEPEVAAEITRMCGWLPLALRVIAARLAARPNWPLRALLERLSRARRRLDELEADNIDVRASFTVSLNQLRASNDTLDQRAAAAFALLGILDGPDCSTAAAGRLIGLGDADTEQTLERLADTQLLATTEPGRYRLHDLLRLFAREIAEQDHPPRQRADALTRVLGLYTGCAWRTIELLRPGDHRLTRAEPRWRKDRLEFGDEQAALRWLEAEGPNLLAAVHQAAITPSVPAEIVVQLAQALAGFFWRRPHWDGWMQISQIALEAASRVGDPAGRAQAHSDLGLGHWRQGRYDQALTSLQESLAIWRELGDRLGEGASLRALGIVYERQGRYEQALTCQQESLEIGRELGDCRGEASALANLGTIYQQLGRSQQALECQQQSLAIFRELGDREGEAICLDNLGVAHEREGCYDQAVACLQASLSICQCLNDRDGEAYSLNDLGVVYRRQGRHDQALACQRESLAIRQDLGDRYGQASSLRELGVTLRELKRFEEAREHWADALAIFGQLQTSDADHIRDLLANQPR